VGRPIGYDALPAVLRASRILTGNDLGRLANSAAMPEWEGPERRPADPVGPEALERAIQAALSEENLPEAWRLVALRKALG
jgi:hypothetical protein